MRKSMAEQFIEKAEVEKVVKERFPKDSQGHIRETAKEIATMFGKSLRGDELEDDQAIKDLLQLSILLAPIRTLDEELRKAANADIPPTSIPNCVDESILFRKSSATVRKFALQYYQRFDVGDFDELTQSFGEVGNDWATDPGENDSNPGNSSVDPRKFTGQKTAGNRGQRRETACTDGA